MPLFTRKFDNKLNLVLKSVFTALILGSTAITSSMAVAGYQGIKSEQINNTAGVTLNEDIRGSHGGSVFIQYGVVNYNINESNPYCYFKISRDRSELGSPFDLKAVAFQVLAVDNNASHVQVNPKPSSYVQLAGLGGAISEGGAANQLTLKTTFHLSDASQPNVNRLICAIHADLRDRGYLSLKEMQDTMGDLVTLIEN